MKTEEEKNIENKPLEDTDTVQVNPNQLSPTQLNYIDTVTMDNTPILCSDPSDLTETITLDSEIKLFAKKFSYHERENCNCPGRAPSFICPIGCPATDLNCCNKPSQGDDLGFTLVFGNYGNQTYNNTSGTATLTDSLVLGNDVRLTLVSLCIDDDYQLINGTTGLAIQECDTFTGTTLLTLRRYDDPRFSIPCHYVCSISMLFRVDPVSCKCPCAPCPSSCCLEEN